jgi:hypothetical protein
MEKIRDERLEFVIKKKKRKGKQNKTKLINTFCSSLSFVCFCMSFLLLLSSRSCKFFVFYLIMKLHVYVSL